MIAAYYKNLRPLFFYQLKCDIMAQGAAENAPAKECTKEGKQMNKKLRRTISAVLASAVMLTSMTGTQVFASAEGTSVTATATAEKTYTIKSKSVNTYFFDYSDQKMKTKLYFMNGVNDVPYIEINDMAGYLIDLTRSRGFGTYDLKVEEDGDTVTLTRENNYMATINFADDSIFFWDFDGFYTAESKTLIDLIVPFWDTYDEITGLKTVKSTERYGTPVTMNAADYGIDFVRKGDKYYIPLQTFSDIFLAPAGAGVILYNGRSLIFCRGKQQEFYADGKLTKLGQVYYGKNGKYATNKISKELAEFSAAEFCFAMDNLYGLREKHSIDNFGTLLLQRESGFKLFSTKSKTIDKELHSIVTDVLDDNHSAYVISSYASGIDYTSKLAEKYGGGRADELYMERIKELMRKRAEYYPEGVPYYEEVGDTAYITFDLFSIDMEECAKLDYNDPSTIAGTFGAISYAVNKINRKDSPIKNVVLDLSCNAGGATDAAVFTIASFLGKAGISIENSKSGALVTNYYKADTNFDGKYDSDDTLAGKGLNLYCLTSTVSFSCGNLVPCAFKEDPHVSIIGQKSAGGACVVGTVSTATGAVINISSNFRLSYTKNGSFYDVDQGAEPDYSLSKLEHFYDREWLTNYIDSLA